MSIKKAQQELARIEDKSRSIKSISDLYLPDVEIQLRTAKVTLRSPLVSDMIAVSKNKEGDVASTNSLLARIISRWEQPGDSRDYATLLDVQSLPVKDWYKLTDGLRPLLESAEHDIESIPEGTVIRFKEPQGIFTIALRNVTFGDLEKGDNAEADNELKATIDWIYGLTAGWDLTPLNQPIDRTLFDRLEIRYSRVFQEWANTIVEGREEAETRELEDYSSELLFLDGTILQFREPTARDLEFLETLNLEKIGSILKAIERFCVKWNDTTISRDFIRKQDAKYFFAIANHFKSLLQHESNPYP